MFPVIGTNICHLNCCQCIAIGEVCPFGSQNHYRHNQDSSNECPCSRNTCAFSKNTKNKDLIMTHLNHFETLQASPKPEPCFGFRPETLAETIESDPLCITDLLQNKSVAYFSFIIRFL